MPIAPRPGPDATPPAGVPRWLWPPPGATVAAVVLSERVDGSGVVTHRLEGGEPLDRRHLRALHWLLDEHPRAELPGPGCPFEGSVRIEIATTALAGGRIGHAYALNGGPLGAPGAAGARGIVWRYLAASIGI